MAKHFWFKFEWEAWRGDKALRRCTKETRGFWIDCIAEMEDQNTYFLQGTPDQLCRDLFCTREEFDRSVNDLIATKAAEIEKCQDFVKIMSRRLLRKYNLTEYNRLKKRESRSQEHVKPESNAPSKDIEIKSLRVLEESPIGDSKSAAKPAVTDPVERRIWTDGVELLTHNGTNEAAARSFLGKLVKDYSREMVAESIAATQAENAADPKSFLVGVLKKRSGVADKEKSAVGKSDPSITVPAGNNTCRLGHEFCLQNHREG